MEFYAVVTRKLVTPLSEAAAQAMVEEMARLPVVPADAQLVVSAILGQPRMAHFALGRLDRPRRGGLRLRALLSEDLANGAVYGSVRVDNPFLVRPRAPRLRHGSRRDLSRCLVTGRRSVREILW